MNLASLLAVLACAGALVSGYLLYTAAIVAQLPAGCGPGSGCAAVLSSRWGGTFGIPVSAAALFAQFGVLALIPSLRSRDTAARERARLAGIALGTAMLGAAFWFIVIQFVVVKAICPWCMADHAIGIALALVLLTTPRSEARAGTVLNAVGTGAVAVAVLVAGQYAVHYQPGSILRLPPGQDADTGPGPNRAIQLLDGGWRLDVADVPVLGSPSAPHLLVVQFDYCCPHCRRTHDDLLEILARRGDEFGVLMIPMPMNASCNAHVDETEPRFEPSCTLARLALAMWYGAPEAFAAFDAWLFGSDESRSGAEARAEAERLAGDLPLDDPRIEVVIAQSVRSYHASGAERIPVIRAVGLAPIVGRLAGAAELESILDRELLAPVQEGP